MEVYVLGNDLEIIDMIDSYESIIWTVQYFSQNDFQLIVPATPYYIKLLQKDRLLWNLQKTHRVSRHSIVDRKIRL